MPVHTGSCHCGEVRFEFGAEITHARVCDCSICRKRGAMNFRIEREALTLLSDWEGLSVYRWGSKTAADYFCPRCGIMPFRRPSDPTPQERAEGIEPFDGWAVNLRCVDGVDLDALEIRRIEGRLI